jgi:hypothetical protein
VKPARLLERLLAGHLANVAFVDLLRLVEPLGFELLRVSGSHRVFSHPDVLEPLCLQPYRGDAWLEAARAAGKPVPEPRYRAPVQYVER